ncbi:MAG: SMP-30/Gluconolaconase/LRE-like region [Verrucomicrobia bacterium ADurb.Bin070]|nr:MAG: SMP-30/Gluconolaconase/LRE-like region [Verrucomicrobia bacterium ADurb.Bin070]
MSRVTMCFMAGLILAATFDAAAAEDCAIDQKYRPKLFKQFGDHVNVPDGLAQDRHGNVYCAAPNFVNQSYPGTIMKMDKKTGKWSVFVAGLNHPETGRGFPMGMEFGEDGHLYYCDNQYFADKNYKSRVMRVVIDKNGEPQRIEPVVENIKLANAMRTRGNAIYFTETFFDLEGKNLGGVYRVPISAFKERPVRLLAKAHWQQDPYCIGVTETTPLPHRKDTAATDGMCFDKEGNIYTGNFGDGHFYVLRLQRDGSYAKPETLIYDPKIFPSCDGVCYYAKKNWVIITDSERNAVRYWDIKAGTLGLLWENGDTDGADGLLDQPCEPMVWGDKLIVVNFDMKFPGLLNSANDSVHTVSVIDLDRGGGPFLNLFR